MRVEINQKKLLDAMTRFPEQTFKNVNLELQKGSRDIQLLARANHRFTSRTGALERSIETKHTPSKLMSKVGINKRFAKYGLFIHDGFKTWRPDPFITEAGESLTDDVKSKINSAVTKSMRGSFRG